MRLYLLLGIVMAGYIVKLNGKGFLNHFLLNKTLIKFCFVNFVFSLFLFAVMNTNNLFWPLKVFSKMDNINGTTSCELL